MVGYQKTVIKELKKNIDELRQLYGLPTIEEEENDYNQDQQNEPPADEDLKDE